MDRYNKVSVHALPLAVEIIIGHHNPSELDRGSLIKQPLKCVPETCAVAAGMLREIRMAFLKTYCSAFRIAACHL